MRASRFVLGCAVGLACAYGLYLRSEAYRNGNRLFYAEGRPNRAGRLFGDWWTLIGGLGLTPPYLVALETTGHRTGRVRSVPVVIGEYAGDRYIVSMLGGRSPWVRNVRAAGGRAVIRHGRRHEVRLVEVPPAERAPIIKAYVARAAGARPHIPVDPSAPVEAFAAIAAGYPVFRIEASTPAEREVGTVRTALPGDPPGPWPGRGGAGTIGGPGRPSGGQGGGS